MSLRKVLFLDRDGTLIVEPKTNFQVDSLEKLEFMPGVFQNLAKIVNELDYDLVIVTNQDGLGTAEFPYEDFNPAHEKMLKAFENEGITFKDVYIDESYEHENLPTRKPGIGLLDKYINGPYDLKNSFVIGDRRTDVEMAQNLGAKAIFISDETDDRAALSTNSWWEIYEFLKKQ